MSEKATSEVSVATSPIEPEKALGRPISLRSVSEVAPGSTGMLPIRMSGSADLVAIEVEEGVELVRILASKVDLSLKEEGFTIQQILDREHVRLKGFVTLIARNTTSVPKSLAGTLRVDKEEVAPTEVIPAQRSHVSSASTSAVRKQVVRAVPTPRYQHRIATSSAQGHAQARGAAVDSWAVRHLTKDHLDMVLPRDGEHAVLLGSGHVFGLMRFLKNHVPVYPSFGPSICRQLMSGLQRIGAVSTGGGEVVVCFTDAQITSLHMVVKRRHNHLSSEETEALLHALQAGIDRENRASSQTEEELPPLPAATSSTPLLAQET